MLRNLFLNEGLRGAYAQLFAAENEGGVGAGEEQSGTHPAGQAEGQQGAGEQGSAGGAAGEGAEGVQDAGEGGDEGAGAGEGDGAARAGSGGETPPVQQTDWMRRELNRKHAQNLSLKQERDQLKRERDDALALAERVRANGGANGSGAQDGGAEVGQDGGGAHGTGNQPQRQEYRTQAEFEAAVQRESQSRVMQEQFVANNRAAEEIGKKVYGAEWDKALANLQTIGGADGAFDVDTMLVIHGTDNPAKVLYELGRDPNKYHEIMDLPPHKRFARLGLLAAAPEPRKKVSEAPPPVDSIGGRSSGNTNELRDDLSDDEWYRRFNAREAEKRQRRMAAANATRV
jgi:hypothetical protein